MVTDWDNPQPPTKSTLGKRIREQNNRRLNAKAEVFRALKVIEKTKRRAVYGSAIVMMCGAEAAALPDPGNLLFIGIGLLIVQIQCRTIRRAIDLRETVAALRAQWGI